MGDQRFHDRGLFDAEALISGDGVGLCSLSGRRCRGAGFFGAGLPDKDGARRCCNHTCAHTKRTGAGQQ
ncbi:hypothetical protein AUP44_03650 [Tistrella mobilis]|uniref:Uncharacterized protein n=1 Tax=Tistrella mobilis TaxID=171437 RepID=A0A162L5Q4_9PROT|nr:hypothetical protein AUP44_03650 [Tistrella mobilis]